MGHGRLARGLCMSCLHFANLARPEFAEESMRPSGYLGNNGVQRGAEDLLIQQFVVASDAKQVIADIQQGSKGKKSAIIKEIVARSISFSCNFVYESRLVHMDAHNPYYI